MGPVTPTPALRVKAAPGPAALMRLVTAVLALMLVVLGVLAAQHAQTSQGEIGHTVLMELEVAHQPLTAVGGAVSDTAGELLTFGLVAGCIVLIICCALGLALLAARAWRAEPFRRLGRAVQLFRAMVGGAIPAGGGARPSLIALSISRT